MTELFLLIAGVGLVYIALNVVILVLVYKYMRRKELFSYDTADWVIIREHLAGVREINEARFKEVDARMDERRRMREAKKREM